MPKTLEFMILIDRKIRLQNQDHNFEHFYGYREDLEKSVEELGWKAVFHTLGGVKFIGAYYSFNASFVSNSGSLINIVYNRDSTGPNGYQKGLIVSDEESIAVEDLNVLEDKIKERHPAYFLETRNTLSSK
ncbi:hypothetical protein HYV89_05145 [Candidatus Woesearchaeota archaeon]|nr:hypothetical protein [Candidatus Woesearchaeota archaeon]